MARDDGYDAIRAAYNKGMHDTLQYVMPGRTTQTKPNVEAYIDELKKQPMKVTFDG